MTDHAPATRQKSILGRSAGELVLRVVGGPRDGQVVRLASAKCTVGSDHRCTVRLGAKGIRPCHCLILRGQRTTIIRRWAPDTRLNGRGFTDRPLRTGDDITVGSIRLEVLSIGEEVLSAGEKEPPDHPTEPPSADLAATEALIDQKKLLDRRQAEWNETQQTAQAELDQQAMRLESERAEFEASRKTLHERAEQLRSQAATLKNAREALDAEQTGVASGHKALHERHDEMEAERERLDAERRDWQQQREQTELELTNRQNDLEHRETEIDQQRRDLEEQRRDLEEQRRDLEEQRRDLETQRTQWQQTASTPSAEKPDAPTRPDSGEESREEAPASTQDIFSNLREMQILREDNDQDAAPEVTTSSDAEPPDTEPTDANGKSEESIEQYMRKLLDRVRGCEESPAVEPQPQPPTAHAAPSASVPSPTTATSDEPEPDITPDEPAPRPQFKPGDTKPHSTAPELTSDIRAMRELTRSAVRNAIEAHATKRRWVRAAMGKMVVGAAGLVAGVLLLSWPDKGNMTLFAGGVVALLVAVFWMLQAGLIVRSVVKLSGDLPAQLLAGTGKKNSADPAEAESE